MGIDPIPKDFQRRIRQAADEADFTRFMESSLPKVKEWFVKQELSEEAQEKILHSLNLLLLNVWMEARRTLRDSMNAEPKDNPSVIV